MSLIADRADTVREIFKLSVAGLGSELIAQQLNDSRKSFTGYSWRKSYVEKILRHPATFGAFQPYKRLGKNRRTPEGDLVYDFFPAAIDYAAYQAATKAREARYRSPKGSSTATMRNLFAGLVTDRDLNRSMVLMLSRGKPYLVTDSYRVRIKPNRFEYDRFERWFLTFLDQLDWTTILDVAESEDLKRAEDEIGRLALGIERGEQQVQKLTDLLLDTPSKALKERLLKTEAQIEQQKSDKLAAEKRLAELKRKHSDLLDKSVVYTQLAKASDLETRARLREEIRRKVTRIEFAFHKQVSGDDDTLVAVTFANEAILALVFCKDGRVLSGSLDDPASWLVVTPANR
jgi:hypothetical protein